MPQPTSSETLSTETKSEDVPASDAPIDLLAYTPLVRSIARRIYASIPSYAQVDLNDLVQSGHVGLVHAGNSYRSDRRVPFAVYARFRIRGEILDSLRQVDVASRTMRRLDKRIKATRQDLVADLKRDPTDAELNEKLNADAASTGKHTDTNFLQLPVIAITSLDGLDAGTESWRAPGPGPETLRCEKEAGELLRAAIGRLPERSRTLIQLYYQSGLTMRQIGEHFHVNESRVSQIHRRALEHLARHLRTAGVHSSREI